MGHVFAQSDANWWTLKPSDVTAIIQERSSPELVVTATKDNDGATHACTELRKGSLAAYPVSALGNYQARIEHLYMRSIPWNPMART